MSAAHQIDVERVICRLDDLGDSGSRGFAIGSGDWPLRGFVVRSKRPGPRVYQQLSARQASAQLPARTAF